MTHSVITPKIELKGEPGEPLPTLGRVLREPARWWPAGLAEARVVHTRCGSKPLALVCEPGIATEMLSNRSGDFPRSPIETRIFGQGYGNTLIQGEQSAWRSERGTIGREISMRNALAMIPAMAEACETIMEEWSESAPHCAVDLMTETRRLSLDAAYRALFVRKGEKPAHHTEINAVAKAIAAHDPCALPEELRLLKPIAEMLSASSDVDLGEDGQSILAGMDANNLLLLLHAAHDNTAMTLAWALWLLAQRTDLQAQIRREWAASGQDGVNAAGSPTADAVVSETLRLYPPVMQMMRAVTRDSQVGDFHFAAGTTAIFAIYAMQRSPHVWDDPDLFRPERFRDEPIGALQKASLLAFGRGPRSCIGRRLAEVQLQLFLSMICSRFNLSIDPERPLKCHVEWSLRPTGRAPLILSALD